jgi:predicted ATPase
MRNKIYVGDIILAPLDVGVVYQWISDTLQGTVSNNTDQVHDKGEVMKLAEMIHKKTGGNPFFMKMFLLALHSEGLITREGLLWKWDLEKIKQQRATDNVVNLMTHRIDQFSGTTEEVLKWASCMGNNFDFNKLSSVMHKSKATLMGELYPVLNAGMVIMLNDRFHFAHDRVQEACYARLSERERNVIHYSIGRNWRKLILENEERTDSGKSSMDAGKDMFEVVDHLNKGVGILWDTTAVEVLKELDQRPIGQQLEEMADFNLSMGKQAQDAAAYSSAINYFKAGVACALRLCETDSESWEKHHDIVYSLHSELATTYSLTADYESANRVIDLLLTKAKDKIELSTIYTLQILQENVYSNFEKSLEIGRLALHQFGIDLPPSNDPTIPEHITQEMQLIEQRIEELRNKETGEVDLSPLLFTPDVETQCLYKIIATLLVTAYLFDPIIFPLMASISTRVVLNRCVSSTTTTMFSYFAIVLSTREAFSLVHDFSEIILQCVREQFPLDYAEKCRTMHLYNIFVHHWFYPIRELIPSCHELTVIGLESGETTYATYVYSILCPIHMLVGNDIDHVVSDVEAGLTVAHKYKNHIIRELNTQILTEYRIMQGSKYSTDQAKVDKMEKEMYESTVNEFPRVQHLIFRVMIDFIIEEDYKGPGEELMTWAKTKYQKLLDIDPKLPFIVSMYLNAIIHYYESLTLIRILRALDSKDEKDCIDLATSINLRLQKNIKQLTRWSDLCPANFLNKLVLVQAEMSAYISKDGWAAIQLYEKYVYLNYYI